jgi:hypothetical protein
MRAGLFAPTAQVCQSNPLRRSQQVVVGALLLFARQVFLRLYEIFPQAATLAIVSWKNYRQATSGEPL